MAPSLNKQNVRPHAVFMCSPALGHENPMLQFAKVLHQNGFHITFVNTEYIQDLLLKDIPDIPSFQFETIPDGLPPSDPNARLNFIALAESLTKNCLAPFRDLLTKLNNSTENPPVTCLITDCMMSFTLHASEELNLPNFFFCTASVCGFVGDLYSRTLLEKGVVPFKDESYFTNGYLDTPIDWIKGMENIPLKALPTFLRTTNADDYLFHFVMTEIEASRKASGVIFNSFDELEDQVLSKLSSALPNPFYTVGPLKFLLQNSGQQNDAVTNIRTNSWKEQSECIEWLDSKPPESVLYIYLGGFPAMPPEQLVEFAWGLANSKRDFLWVVWPEVVSGDSPVIPPEFLEEIEGRGKLVSWCRQDEVLSHRAIGGFLTHGGWNSTVDGLCGGVPVVFWPFFAEQPTNSWFAREKWGNGIEIGGEIKREGIEGIVRELMEGEKGKELRGKAKEWKRKAEIATSVNGSSYVNLEKLISKLTA